MAHCSGKPSFHNKYAEATLRACDWHSHSATEWGESYSSCCRSSWRTICFLGKYSWSALHWIASIFFEVMWTEKDCAFFLSWMHGGKFIFYHFRSNVNRKGLMHFSCHECMVGNSIFFHFRTEISLFFALAPQVHYVKWLELTCTRHNFSGCWCCNYLWGAKKC